VTRIILVRHGRTAWNEGNGERLRGRSEIELNDEGIVQAQSTARKLSQWAESLKLRVESFPALIDIDYGKWQGLSLSEAAADNEALYKLWLNKPDQVRFPGGETLEEVGRRALGGVEAVASRNPDLTTVLVSHKVVCQALICRLMGLELRHFWNVRQDLCAVNVVEMTDNGPALRLVNDTCHLKEPA